MPSVDTSASEEMKRLGPRRIAWLMMTILCVISLILSAFSANNYMEIANARVLTFVSTDDAVTLAFDSLGNLESVNLTIEFTIINPSRKEVRAWVLTYKGWLRDFPLEDRTDTSRWMIDGRLDENGTQMRYYPVFVTTYSFDNPQVIVPPLTNLTLTRHVEVTQNNYPDILANIASIHNHTTALGKTLEWLHYTTSILFIQGIPSFSGTNQDANLIKRFDGIDITPGVGGAGT